jgi:3'-5' exoribonuclease
MMERNEYKEFVKGLMTSESDFKFYAEPVITQKFMEGVGAHSHHHNYKGGLAEHTLEVIRLAHKGSFVYNLNTNLCILGALYHDIGKLQTYKILENGQIRKTDEYYDKGHFLIGYEKARSLLRNSHYKKQILHIILSHHGDPSNGWGSIVAPITQEAKLIHHCDLISSRLGRVQNE